MYFKIFHYIEYLHINIVFIKIIVMHEFNQERKGIGTLLNVYVPVCHRLVDNKQQLHTSFLLHSKSLHTEISNKQLSTHKRLSCRKVWEVNLY